MHVFYLKSTFNGLIRDEKRTDWTMGSRFCDRMDSDLPTVADLATDYDKVFMSTESLIEPLNKKTIEGVFHDFQGEFMSKFVREQVCSVTRRSHTSMSVGDIVVDHGNIWFCDFCGFTLIGEVR